MGKIRNIVFEEDEFMNEEVLNKKLSRRSLLKILGGMGLVGEGIIDIGRLLNQSDDEAQKAFPNVKEECGAAANPGNYSCKYTVETSSSVSNSEKKLEEQKTLETYRSYRNQMVFTPSGVARIIADSGLIFGGILLVFKKSKRLYLNGGDLYERK